jgi:phosphoribosylanthranilate isomerase
MMKTRVKICGITRVEDALEAAKQGADAIGLVFYAPSPRNVSIEVARAIVAALPPFVSLVGLFVNAPKANIDAVLAEVRLDVLQFHGDENPTDCTQFNLPFLKAIRVNADTNLLQYEIARCAF